MSKAQEETLEYKRKCILKSRDRCSVDHHHVSQASTAQYLSSILHVYCTFTSVGTLWFPRLDLLASS